MGAVYALWHEASGAPPSGAEAWADLERFASIRAAKAAMRARCRPTGHPVAFRYLDHRGTPTRRLPGAAVGSVMWIYQRDPRACWGAPWPDRRLTLSARGRVVVERC